MSLVKCHLLALVHVHVGITEEALGHSIHVPRLLQGQRSQWQVQVFGNFRAQGYCGNVEAIFTTVSVGHAVEEHPVVILRAILHKGHIVTGLDAEHCKELHLLMRDLLAAPGAPGVEFLWDVQLSWLVGFAAVVGVNLSGAGAAELLQARSCKHLVFETL